MRKKLCKFLLSASFLLVAFSAAAQNYDRQWKAVEKALDEDLPKTALTHLDAIRNDALRTKSTPQLIRALFTAQVLQQEVARDSGAVYLKHIETALAQETRPVERALYQNALARLLLLQTVDDSDETAIRVKKLLVSSMEEVDKLGKARTKDFFPLFEVGGSSRTVYQDDLLSVLTLSMIEIIDEHDVMKTMFSNGFIDSLLLKNLEFYEREQNLRAMLFTDLHRADLRADKERSAFLEKIRLRYIELPENVNTYSRLCQELEADRLDEAVALAREGMNRYGRNRTVELDDFLKRVENPQLVLSWENLLSFSENTAFYPGLKYKAKIRSQNIRTLQVRFHRLNGVRGNDPRLIDAFESNRIERLFRQVSSTEELSLRRTLKSVPAYREYEDSISFHFPKAGVYLIELLADGHRKDVQLAYAAKAQRLIFHAVSHEGSVLRTRFVDAVSGSAESLDNDSIYLPPLDYGNYNSYGDKLPLTSPRREGKVRLFTDRAIYRPGQAVEISGLVYAQMGDNIEVVSGWKGELIVFDAQGKKLDVLSVSSDEMGVFSTKIILPKYCRPGRFGVSLPPKSDFQARIHFRVEEYKRPTFSVTIDTLAATPYLGDRVTFRGHVRTYNDLPLEKARVKWQLKSNSLWRDHAQNQLVYNQSGELSTDENGFFQIEVQLGDTISSKNSYYFTLSAEVLAENGETQIGTRSVLVRSSKPFPKPTEARKPIEVIADKEKGIFKVAISAPMFVHYDLVSFEGGLLESKIFAVTDSATFIHQWKETYGDAAVAYYAAVKNGKLISQKILLERPRPDKRLVLSWKTFRSRLQPGQEEEWTLSVKHPDGKTATANVLATLYDASLNTFATNKWNFSLYFSRNKPLVHTQCFSAYTPSLSATYEVKYRDVPLLSWTRWREDMFSYNRRYTVGFGAKKPALRIRGLSKVNEMTGNISLSVSEDAETAPQTTTAEEKSDTFDFGAMTIRRNFDETAFFLPRLRTDEKGEVTLRFTLPESLTQWQLNVFAHDAELRHALLTENIVARKLLMAEAALPRFLREGDETDFSVTVRNVDEIEQKGILHFMLSDSNGKMLKKFRKPFELAPGKSLNTSFSYAVPTGQTELIARFIAKSETYSDGEERVIPILSRQITLTHAVPFTVKSGENYTQKETEARRRLLGELEAGVHPKLSVDTCRDARSEVTNVVPKLLENKGESSIDKAIALYAIELVAALPQYLAIESAELAARRAEAVDRLRELQSGEGGWAWYPGMHTSAWITADITLLLARLSVLTGEQHFRPMLQRAVRYLDHFIRNEVEKMKEEKQPSFYLGEVHWRYLYIDRLLGRKPSSDVNYLLSRAAHHRKEMSMYGKSGQAVVLAGTKHDAEARLALRSVIEHTVFSEEMGRYFDTDRALQGYASYRIPTQIFAMEALDRLTNPEEALGGMSVRQLVDEMKLWLLQSKRTQVWNTSRATVDAVYALLRQPDDANAGLAWGAVTATYRLPAAKAAAKGNGLHLERRLEIKKGTEWQPVALNQKGETDTPIHIGDRVRWVYTLVADRDFDHVVLRSSRPACFETAHPLSGYSWQHSLAFYRMVRDSANEYFTEHLAKGRHVFTEEMFVDRAGRFDGGLGTLECVFAPEFTGNSSHIVVKTFGR